MVSTKKAAVSAKPKQSKSPFDTIFAPRAKLSGTRPTPTIPEATGKVYGYARTSTEAQRLDRQIDALNAEGCDEIFTDQITGTTLVRDGLKRMCYQLEAGDTVVVAQLSRLGRSSHDILRLIATFSEIGVGFKAISDGIDTRKDSGVFFIGIMALLAQVDRDNISSNTRRGLEAAAARGNKGGRKPVITKGAKARQLQKYLAKGMTHREAAKLLEVSRSSIYRWVQEKAEADASDNPEEFYEKYDIPDE